MTDAEKKLWQHHRRKQLNGLRFLRQYSIDNYIVDFYCPAKRMAIEIDGGQHCDSHNIKKDSRRTQQLNQRQIKVIRFWNNEVLTSISGVMETIKANI